MKEITDKLEFILGCMIGSHTYNTTPEHQIENLITELKAKNNEVFDLVMPRLICHYNEQEGGYLTVGKVYEAEAINGDGFEIRDDSGTYNTYSTAYLNVV